MIGGVVDGWGCFAVVDEEVEDDDDNDEEGLADILVTGLWWRRL